MSGSTSTKTTPIKLTQVSSSINNSLGGLNINSSPVLPMTPSTSVSPPVNIICKKELNSFHPNSTSVPNDLKPISSSIHHPYNDGIKCESELTGLSHHSVYSNINSRLGQSSGNLTPMGSSSSMQTTPSPPITPQSSINPLGPYVSHDYNNPGFWNYGNHYPSNYGNTPYYSQQMEYFQNQNPNNYNLSHSSYQSGNFSLPSGTALGPMSSQSFTQNSLDYLNPADKLCANY